MLIYFKYLQKKKQFLKPKFKRIYKYNTDRGIYNNMMGYLGGIQCAMLVAKVCMKFPDAPANILLHRFFFNFSKWCVIQIKTICNC